MTPTQHRAALQAAHEAYQRVQGAITGPSAMEVAIEAYADALRDQRPEVPSAAKAFFRAILAEHGMTIAELAHVGAQRPRRLVASKQLVLDEALLVMRAWPLSQPVLGALAHRDHSSVIVAIRRAHARMEADDVMRARVARLTAGMRDGVERRAVVG